MLEPLPPDPYKSLDLPDNAPADAIKKRYRELILKCHPDKVPESEKAEATNRFAAVQGAWEILGDAGRREGYHKLVQQHKLAEELTRHHQPSRASGGFYPSPQPAAGHSPPTSHAFPSRGPTKSSYTYRDTQSTSYTRQQPDYYEDYARPTREHRKGTGFDDSSSREREREKTKERERTRDRERDRDRERERDRDRDRDRERERERDRGDRERDSDRYRDADRYREPERHRDDREWEERREKKTDKDKPKKEKDTRDKKKREEESERLAKERKDEEKAARKEARRKEEAAAKKQQEEDERRAREKRRIRKEQERRDEEERLKREALREMERKAKKDKDRADKARKEASVSVEEITDDMGGMQMRGKKDRSRDRDRDRERDRDRDIARDGIKIERSSRRQGSGGSPSYMEQAASYEDEKAAAKSRAMLGSKYSQQLEFAMGQGAGGGPKVHAPKLSRAHTMQPDLETSYITPASSPMRSPGGRQYKLPRSATVGVSGMATGASHHQGRRASYDEHPSDSHGGTTYVDLPGSPFRSAKAVRQIDPMTASTSYYGEPITSSYGVDTAKYGDWNVPTSESRRYRNPATYSNGY
ncbi:hypothetical protein RB598_009555 [Gaeumannomyces tritici]